MKASNLAFLVITLILTASCTKSASDSENTSERKTFTVDTGDVINQVVIDGNLYSPLTKAVIIERVRWYWEYNVSWVAEEGATVKQGDIVARLDPATILSDLTKTKAELDKDNASMESTKINGQDKIAEAQAEVLGAEFDLKKAKLNVVNNDTISANEKKKQIIEVSASESNLKRAKEKVEAAKKAIINDIEMANLNRVRMQLEYKELQEGLVKLDLKAPQDGLLLFPVISSSGSPSKAKPGMSVRTSTVIAEVANPKDLVARLFVPEIDMDGIKVDTPASLTLDIQPKEIFSGKVVRIEKVATTQAEREGSKNQSAAQKVRQFEVQVALSNLPTNATPGLTVRAVLTPYKKNNVVRIPIEAVNKALRVADAPYTTEVSDEKNGSFTRRTIKLGAISALFAEVISGLKPGEIVRNQ